MTFKLSIRDLAARDLQEAYDQYEEKQPGLGDRFHDEVARVLARIKENPRLYPVSDVSRYRKAVLASFPFVIYYCVIGAKIIVIAVHDGRRDPQRWKRRAT
jgi:plasmid stabilization system protein ParE